MIRNYCYPLYVNYNQESFFENGLWRTRVIYNASLEERKTAWEREKKSISYNDQTKSLTQIRADDPEYESLPATMSRGPLKKLKRSFKAFFKRCREGAEEPGYPRFKGSDGWDSLDFGSEFKIEGDHVILPKIGSVRFKRYREIKGKPLNCIVKREKGKWFVYFQCRVEAPEKIPVQTIKTATGIDLGLTKFITLASGKDENNPRFGKALDDRIAEADRAVSRKKKRSNNRRKAKQEVARLYARAARLRRNFGWQLAAKLFKQFDMICYEELNILGMVLQGRTKLTKSILDAAWAQFIHCLVSKAESAGKRAVGVDPRGTTQDCSGCGTCVPKGLGDRIHSCPHCGLVLGRDHNAAINILNRGMRLVGLDNIQCNGDYLAASVK